MGERTGGRRNGKVWYALLMRTRSLNHCCYKHNYHIVWSTRYRYKYLKDYVVAELTKSINETLGKYPTLHLETINTDKDHVHLQIEIPPNITVSKVVQVLKQYSSKHLKSHFKFIRRMYLEHGIWSVGYFSSTVGLNEDTIRHYIQWQGRHELPVTQTSLEFSGDR